MTQERGTGKTTKLLKATPNDSFFIVHSQGMVNYIKHWIHQDRESSGNITVVSMENLNALRGHRKPIVIDHTITDGLCSFIEKEQEDELKMYCSFRAPFVVFCDEGGDVRITWNR